jgi:glycosyltransferase involved in cell wall biosynthesis
MTLLSEILFWRPLFAQEETSPYSAQQVQTIKESRFAISLLQPEKVKICLNMIVKNESQIIERCLESVKNIVDCISICDTGSTDNTIEIIEQFMQRHHIPGKVHRHVWKNFGYNRSLSALTAQKTLEELGFPLSNTYLLLLDADMILEVDPNFKKYPFIADSYLVLQKNDLISYYNIRLIRASLPWECLGVTHEYWSCKQPAIEMQLRTLKIDDREDGGCKSDKFERDVKLLTEGLKEDPRNARYMFYLAQSYKCLERFQEAIHWYKERIALDGWKEEVWYSKMMIGEMFHKMNAWDQALHWYLAAYEGNPERAEPLQRIANYYRQQQQYQLAYLFAKQGSRIPYPKNQVLFISHAVYDYQFDEEISIAAYYHPSYREEGFDAADRLVLKRGVPDDIRELTFKNLLFYVQHLPGAQFCSFYFNLPLHSSQQKANCYQLINQAVNALIGSRSSKNPTLAFAILNSKNQTSPLKYPLTYDFSSFHNHVTPVPFDDGYLMLIYQIVEANGQQNVLHRFLYMNKKFDVQKISRPFIFRNKGPEFCQQLAIDPLRRKCFLVLRRENQAPELCSVNIETLRSLLRSLP